MMVENEKLEYHTGNGYANAARGGSSKGWSNKKELGTPEGGRPCEIILFKIDSHGYGELLAIHVEKQSDVASYKHVFSLSEITLQSVARGAIIEKMKKMQFATPADVNEFAKTRGSKLTDGWVDTVNEDTPNAKTPSEGLLYKIITEVVVYERSVKIVVPQEYDLIETFRESARKILECAPYGLWHCFSFSVNESNSERKIQFVAGEVARGANAYLITDEAEDVSEPGEDDLEQIIRRYVHEEDFREEIYRNFEKKYNINFPDVNCYGIYMKLEKYSSSSDENVLDVWKQAHICYQGEDGVVKRLAFEVLKKKLESKEQNIGSVLYSELSECNTLKKLEDRLEKYEKVLKALRGKGCGVDYEWSKKLLERAMDAGVTRHVENELQTVEAASSPDATVENDRHPKCIDSEQFSAVYNLLDAEAIKETNESLEKARQDEAEKRIGELRDALKFCSEEDNGKLKSVCERIKRIQPDDKILKKVIDVVQEVSSDKDMKLLVEIVDETKAIASNNSDYTKALDDVREKAESNENLRKQSEEKMKTYASFIEWYCSNGGNDEKETERHLEALSKQTEMKKRRIIELIHAQQRFSKVYALRHEADKCDSNSEIRKAYDAVKLIFEKKIPRLITDSSISLAMLYNEMLFCDEMMVQSLAVESMDSNVQAANGSESGLAQTKLHGKRGKKGGRKNNRNKSNLASRSLPNPKPENVLENEKTVSVSKVKRMIWEIWGIITDPQSNEPYEVGQVTSDEDRIIIELLKKCHLEEGERTKLNEMTAVAHGGDAKLAKGGGNRGNRLDDNQKQLIAAITAFIVVILVAAAWVLLIYIRDDNQTQIVPTPKPVKLTVEPTADSLETPNPTLNPTETPNPTLDPSETPETPNPTSVPSETQRPTSVPSETLNPTT